MRDPGAEATICGERRHEGEHLHQVYFANLAAMRAALKESSSAAHCATSLTIQPAPELATVSHTVSKT